MRPTAGQGEREESQRGETRAEAGIEEALTSENRIGIIAIGNAPTALLKAIEFLARTDGPLPLVVGVPVGFVKALESKALLERPAIPLHHQPEQKGRYARGSSHCQRPPQDGGRRRVRNLPSSCCSSSLSVRPLSPSRPIAKVVGCRRFGGRADR